LNTSPKDVEKTEKAMIYCSMFQRFNDGKHKSYLFFYPHLWSDFVM